jgi:hypothetical protein
MHISRRVPLVLAVASMGAVAFLAVGQPAAAKATAKATSSSTRAADTSPPINWFKAPGEMNQITAITPGNIWVGGQFDASGKGVVADSVAHWNGKTWNILHYRLLVNPTTFDMAVVSARDIWAVTGSSIVHWNGTTWSTSYRTPHANCVGVIAAGSAGNVWAGAQTCAVKSVLFMYHWTGHAWHIVPVPFPGGVEYPDLNVIAVTGKTAWAIGSYYNPKQAGIAVPFLLHYNGAHWQLVKFPVSSNDIQFPNDIAVGPGGKLWVVGTFMNVSLYWTGSKWLSVPYAASRFYSSPWINGVTFIPGGTAWCVGTTASYPLIEHWSGARWVAMKLPAKLPADTILMGVTATSPSNAWAVGYYGDTRAGDDGSPQDMKTVVLHWNGKTWS